MKQAKRRETVTNKMGLVRVQGVEGSLYALMITALPLFPRESHTIETKKSKEHTQRCIKQWHGTDIVGTVPAVEGATLVAITCSTALVSLV
jgi:hypothetical protein